MFFSHIFISLVPVLGIVVTGVAADCASTT